MNTETKIGILKYAFAGAPLINQGPALPPAWQKKLPYIAFPAFEFCRNGDPGSSQNWFHKTNNQLFMHYIAWGKERFLCFKNIRTLFEFNTPILKKGLRILKDFEKNSTDFEGFVMDFEKNLNSRAKARLSHYKMNWSSGRLTCHLNHYLLIRNFATHHFTIV